MFKYVFIMFLCAVPFSLLCDDSYGRQRLSYSVNGSHYQLVQHPVPPTAAPQMVGLDSLQEEGMQPLCCGATLRLMACYMLCQVAKVVYPLLAVTRERPHHN